MFSSKEVWIKQSDEAVIVNSDRRDLVTGGRAFDVVPIGND